MASDPSAAERNLPPTQYLVLEVLAARHRLGHSHWTFRNSERPAIEALAALDLVAFKDGTVAGSTLAWLTEQGRRAALSEKYTAPKIHVTYGPDPNANTGLNRAAVQEAYELGLTHGRRGWMR